MHTRGYESADRSLVPKTDRAGSGEADSSTAAVRVTTGLTLIAVVLTRLTLIVVVPMQREHGWSGGCSNMRTGFCGCSL